MLLKSQIVAICFNTFFFVVYVTICGISSALFLVCCWFELSKCKFMEPQSLQAVIRQMIKGFIKMKYGLVLCSHNARSCVYKYTVENTKCLNSFYFVLALQLLCSENVGRIVAISNIWMLKSLVQIIISFRVILNLVHLRTWKVSARLNVF